MTSVLSAKEQQTSAAGGVLTAEMSRLETRIDHMQETDKPEVVSDQEDAQVQDGESEPYTRRHSRLRRCTSFSM